MSEGPAMIVNSLAGVAAGGIALATNQKHPNICHGASMVLGGVVGGEVSRLAEQGTMPAFSTMRIVVRSGARVRCTTRRRALAPRVGHHAEGVAEVVQAAGALGPSNAAPPECASEFPR
jgi:hypothetical protein